MTNQYLLTITGIFLGFGGWLVFLTVKYRKLTKKTRLLFSEKGNKGLGTLVEDYMIEVKKAKRKSADLESRLEEIAKLANAGFHKVGFIRYNPFGDVGGNQSFSLCLLDSADNGFVISSIHSREGTRVYSKTVISGASEYNLSEEEKKVIQIAKGGGSGNV